MKIFFILLFIILSSNLAYSQSLESAKVLYQNGDYESAIRIFENQDSEEAKLFLGKSYYALGNYLKAIRILNDIKDNEAVDIYVDAEYTKTLSHFQLKDFSRSLELLYNLKENSSISSARAKSTTTYNQILNYLSLKQRFEAFKFISNDNIRFDILNNAIGKLNYSQLNTLFQTYKNSVTLVNENRISQISSILSDSVSFNQRFNFPAYPKGPDGISYHIGVALPAFKVDEAEYEISQHIYFGIESAVEDFNELNSSKKVFLHFVDTNSLTKKPEDLLNTLIWEKDVDAVIGPLFSDTAQDFALIAKEYEVPVLTPLANSDNLNQSNNYLFQLNPTFKVMGEQMARYAVNTLGLDTLAIFAEKNSLGANSAFAFRSEAEKLGAVIEHFFVEDLASEGYDVRNFTNQLVINDSTNISLKGVYLPFTGGAANALIKSVLTDFEASNTNMVILGSEEWASANLGRLSFNFENIYYTQSFETDLNSSTAEEFRSNFRLRFKTEPNRFAFIGYDAAQVILNTLTKVENPVYLKEGLLNLNSYQGLSTKVSFQKQHINQSLQIKKLSIE